MSGFLKLTNVGRRFGALWAVKEVTLDIAAGEIVGLIGPNGAGKSTLFNLIAGALSPSEGEIRFEGRTVSGLKPFQVARRGISRTFQIPKPLKQLSVVENVMVSALSCEATPTAARAAAITILNEIGLGPYSDAPIGVLTVGLLKRLEVARTLAMRPRLVLFDEIMAGLTPTEVNEMTALVSSLPGRGITVVWVEHVLHAIMSAAHRIVVLDRGRMIADAAPKAIARDPAVIKAYLGEEMALA
jgi:ABC-type branched-subunit amino acid transport system ATPase component